MAEAVAAETTEAKATGDASGGPKKEETPTTLLPEVGGGGEVKIDQED